jgi:hypothetical protein
MKTYKLIKEYPNSPELDSIWEKPYLMSINYYRKGGGGNLADGIGISTIEKFPEYWE